jgi:hypothetical protein
MLDGVYALLDRPDTPHRAEDWARLAAAGLRHVDIGVVSGSAGVRALHNVPWDARNLTALIEALHAAGVGVGLILPIGAGGLGHDDAHRRDSAALLSTLPLVAGNIVYLIDLHELAGDGTAGALSSRGATPMDDASRVAQMAALREDLRPLRADRKVKIVPYSLDKQ